MTKSGGGTICISVPPLQILGGLAPPVPSVIYAHKYCVHSIKYIWLHSYTTKR